MGGHKIHNQNALHFLTFTVVGWVDVFTRKDYCEIIIESLKYCQQKKGLIICAYVIMSNHLHLIARTSSPGGLSNIIRDFKTYTSKRIVKAIIQNHKESRREWMVPLFKYYARKNSNNKTYQFWKQHNRPIELSSPKWINQKLNYIHLNPLRVEIVANPEDYLFSSAMNYIGKAGKLEIEPIDLGFDIGYIDL